MKMPDAASNRIARLLSPRSVAIIGMSSREGSAGHIVLKNLLANGFSGEIHLVGRTAGMIEGLAIGTDLASLPVGIDLAVLTLPAAGVREALASCVERQVIAVIVFAAGFAEAGEREEQEALGRLVQQGGLTVLGPNTIGYSNYRDGFAISITNVIQATKVARDTVDGVAVVAQSGGLANHFRMALETRGVPVTYNMATGNEMDLGIADFVSHFCEDAATRIILVYTEHIRQPETFLAAARRVRAMGKAIVMLHPGRSNRAQEATLSHTGALAGNYQIMRSAVEREGVVLVESLDELIDTCEVLSRFPEVSIGGLGVMTCSGAFCGISLDLCDAMGLPVPTLSEQTLAALKPHMPSYVKPRNPLDLGTQPVWQPDLVGTALKILLQDEGIGAAVASLPLGSPVRATNWLKNFILGSEGNSKPLVLSILGEGAPLTPEFMEIARASKVVLTRSSDRMMRALWHVLRRRPSDDAELPAPTFGVLPTLTPGTLPEWRGKEYLRAAGIVTPRGGLAHSLDEALATARAIGFPVVLKAQAVSLAHKTEAGGVIVNLADDDALRAGWQKLHANIERAQPGLVLDGVLVEAMVGRGTELVVGGRRDPEWGTVLVVGMGGIFVEVLQDVRILSARASRAEIIAAFEGLRSAKLLVGFRNTPRADIEAAADVAYRIGQLMLQQPALSEIDINPLLVHERGQGVTALDALVVVDR